VAARIREALGVEVEEQAGAYGEFTVLVDGRPVSRGNPIATAFAIVPPAAEVIAAVREGLRSPS
jgi:hypothetical protein